MKVSKSIRRVLAGIALVSFLEAGLVLAAEMEDSTCGDKPSGLTNCTSWGGYYCTTVVQNCTGNCNTCAGPGSFPARMCLKSKGDTCTNSPGSCGASTKGNCQSSGQSCSCDGIEATGGNCIFGNC